MQTLALLVDSWRLLASRKLFWLTLILNLLVVVLYGSIAITEKGVSLGFGLWEIESEEFRLGSPLARTVLMPFINVQIISFWLAWVATGLGLISTASIFPDFLADGAIDMVLAKPISRFKAFVLKFVGALLFVTLQVTVFCVASLLVGRFRLGEWQWMLLAAIPVVVLFFSYIYSVSVLVGVATRSSIAAILAAGIFWLSIWGVQSAEQISLRISTQFTAVTELRPKMIEAREASLARLAAEGKNSENSDEYERMRGRIETMRGQLLSETEAAEQAQSWQRTFYAVTAVIPKTKGTVGLIDRWFAPDTEAGSLSEVLMMTFASRRDAGRDEIPDNEEELRRMAARRGELEAERIETSRSIGWVIGTSLAFEFIILGIAAFIFVRRDF